MQNGFTGITLDRQHQTEEVLLGAGEYLIVPITSGCKLRQYLAEKRKRGSAKGAPISVVNGDKQKVLSDDVVKIFEEVFYRIDLNGDGLLSHADLNEYISMTGGVPLDRSDYQWLLTTFDGDKHAEELSVMGFIKAQSFFYKELQSDDTLVRRELSRVGYGGGEGGLEYSSGKCAVVAVHCDVDFNLETIKFDQAAFDAALQLPVMMYGECQPLLPAVDYYTLDSGYTGRCIVVSNRGEGDVTATFDCTDSQNVVTSKGVMQFQERIPPGREFILHVLPDNYGPSVKKSIKATVASHGR